MMTGIIPADVPCAILRRKGKQKAGMWQGQSRMILGNAVGTSLCRVDGRTDLSPKLEYGFNGSTEKTTISLLSAIRGTATGSICTTLSCLPLPKVRDAGKELESSAGKSLSLESIVAELMGSKQSWLMVSFAIVEIQKELVREVRRREAQSSKVTYAQRKTTVVCCFPFIKSY